jgi:DNA-3-methyladenine glycosylase II
MQEAIDFLTKKDAVFKSIIALYGLPTIIRRKQGIETLIMLILEQQVLIDSAKATYRKLTQLLPDFEPSTMLNLADDSYRNIGVSRQKTSYIKALAQAIVAKKIDLYALENQPESAIRQQLLAIKGIGNWTVDTYLLFALYAPDIMPLGDIAVVNTIKELWGIHDKETQFLCAKAWSPHRSMATFLIWHYYLSKRNRKAV